MYVRSHCKWYESYPASLGRNLSVNVSVRSSIVFIDWLQRSGVSNFIRTDNLRFMNVPHCNIIITKPQQIFFLYRNMAVISSVRKQNLIWLSPLCKCITIAFLCNLFRIIAHAIDCQTVCWKFHALNLPVQNHMHIFWPLKRPIIRISLQIIMVSCNDNHLSHGQF